MERSLNLHFGWIQVAYAAEVYRDQWGPFEVRVASQVRMTLRRLSVAITWVNQSIETGTEAPDIPVSKIQHVKEEPKKDK